MLREHVSCLFASPPIQTCGQLMARVEPVRAEISWPATIVLATAFLLGTYAFLRELYPVRRTETDKPDYEQDPEPKPLRPIASMARDAGR